MIASDRSGEPEPNVALGWKLELVAGLLALGCGLLVVGALLWLSDQEMVGGPAGALPRATPASASAVASATATATTLGPASVIPAPQASVGVDSNEATARAVPVGLRIPVLDLAEPLGSVTIGDNSALNVPEDPQESAWFRQGAVPGDDGSAIVVGHVDAWDGPGVFARLWLLEDGDDVIVDRSDGKTARFEVSEVRQVDKGQFPTEEVYRVADRPVLRLVTCSGSFAEGTYSDNLIVFGELVSLEPAL